MDFPILIKLDTKIVKYRVNIWVKTDNNQTNPFSVQDGDCTTLFCLTYCIK